MTATTLTSLVQMALAGLWLGACHVEETQVRCERNDDCARGEECFLHFCVPKGPSDAANSARDATADRGHDAAGLRRRTTPVLDFSQDDAGSIGDASIECRSTDDEDAGQREGACCEQPAPCYDGPAGTLGVGRCRAGMRPCEDGRLGACEGALLPRAEACDNEGADDDCDGKADDISGRGKACTLDERFRACGEGAMECVADTESLQCALQMPPPELCNTQDDDCDGKVDETFELQTDEMNCGACAATCMAGQVCCDGACRSPVAGSSDGCPECSDDKGCGAGKACCGLACVDLQVDPNNCGACGAACSGRSTCCEGRCVDTRYDENNCGACGTVCSAGTTPTCCGSRCVDVAIDDRNCGQCGNSCLPLCSCGTSNGQPGCRGVLGFCP